MRTMSRSAECRKFSPNIFNKTKCSNCFKQREEHSAEALESNRASRKVSKCGYLFVAPGWDFSDPINRTKRWQRRWFVLYDDGEFTYSVDEHPETVPQCIIDMNSVLEVTPAEDITGHPHSIALTAPDGVHFVKGMGSEESRWWCDVLSVFVRSKTRHKRNATFPGGKSITMIHQPPRIVAATEKAHMSTRPRFNSCHTDPGCRVSASSETLATPLNTDVFTPQPTLLTPDYEDQPASSDSPPTRDKLQTECKTRYRRALAREKRAWRTELVNSALIETDSPAAHTARHLLLDDETRRGEKLKDIADCITRPRRPSSLQITPRSIIEPTRDSDVVAKEATSVTSSEKPIRGDPDGCGLDSVASCYTTATSGSSSAELRVDLPAEDLLHLKKGWLMKQKPDKEWVKHWFVLRGSALMYYRDPSAEDNGILDGVIDLGMVQKVTEIQVARNYGFEIVPWDDKKVVVSALTANIRANWVQALRRAASLPLTEVITPSTPSSSEFRTPTAVEAPLLLQQPNPRASLGARLERQLESTTSLHRPVARTSRTSEANSMSSDDEYRTASSETSAGAHSEWGEAEDACVAVPLPSSSPPLNRTPISRVKERARSRVARRSRTSPPPLGSRGVLNLRRRNLTLDTSDVTDKCDNLPHFTPIDPAAASPSSDSSTLMSPLSPSISSVADKSKLKQNESISETRLAALESQLKDTMTLLDAKEKELKQKTIELANLQHMSHKYQKLKNDHQALSKEWRERKTSEEQWRQNYQQSQSSLEAERLEHQQALDSIAKENDQEIARLMADIKILKNELEKVKDKLQRGIEENEVLCAKLRDVKASPASTPSMHRRYSKRSLSRVDSLSDLASSTSLEDAEQIATWDRDRLEEEYLETLRKLKRAMNEIHASRRELRSSQTECDRLEIQTVTIRQSAQQQSEDHEARANLLAKRVDDLTMKLSAAERQLRQLPASIGSPQLSKLTRSSDKRRSLSLRGRESMQQVSREMEEKLSELENKIALIQTKSASTEQLPIASVRESPRSAKKLDALCLENKSSPRLHRRSSRRKSDLGPSMHQNPPQSPPLLKNKSSRRKSLDGGGPSLELLLRLRMVESKLTHLEEQPQLEELQVMVPEVFDLEQDSKTNSSSTSVSQSTEDISRDSGSAAQKLVGQLWELMGISRRPLVDIAADSREAIEASEAFLSEHRLKLSSQPTVLMQMASVSALSSLLRRCLITKDEKTSEELNRIVHNLSREFGVDSTCKQSTSCQHCAELNKKLKSLHDNHVAELKALTEKLEREKEAAKASAIKEREVLVSQHEQKQKEMQDVIQRLEQRLGTLDSEYSLQIAGLRASYQLSLEQAARGVEGAGIGLDEGVRQRYKAEIQQLRALCEKGLVAMENSHRRIVAELRDEHEQQIQQMKHEKEEALAEETQATLAALDAMRKAHEVEVQKEIEKFKAQYLEKLKASPDVRQLRRDHEQEMSSVRREILSLSEKYSLKCMEAAQLEEQLSSSSRQVQQSQQIISELENRNQQLRHSILSDSRDLGPESPCSTVSDSFLLQSRAHSSPGKSGGAPGLGVALRRSLQSSLTPRPHSHQPTVSFGQDSRTLRENPLQGMVAQRKKLFEQ